MTRLEDPFQTKKAHLNGRRGFLSSCTERRRDRSDRAACDRGSVLRAGHDEPPTVLEIPPGTQVTLERWPRERPSVRRPTMAVNKPVGER